MLRSSSELRVPGWPPAAGHRACALSSPSRRRWRCPSPPTANRGRSTRPEVEGPGPRPGGRRPDRERASRTTRSSGPSTPSSRIPRIPRSSTSAPSTAASGRRRTPSPPPRTGRRSPTRMATSAIGAMEFDTTDRDVATRSGPASAATARSAASAATASGLYKTTNAGASWTHRHRRRRPAAQEHLGRRGARQHDRRLRRPADAQPRDQPRDLAQHRRRRDLHPDQLGHRRGDRPSRRRHARPGGRSARTRRGSSPASSSPTSSAARTASTAAPTPAPPGRRSATRRWTRCSSAAATQQRRVRGAA